MLAFAEYECSDEKLWFRERATLSFAMRTRIVKLLRNLENVCIPRSEVTFGQLPRLEKESWAASDAKREGIF